MPLRDVTAILMGDPGTSPRRAPRPDERRKDGAQGVVHEGRLRVTSWIAQVRAAPVGWEARGVSYYAARKAWLYGRDHGLTIEYWHMPETDNLYGVRRTA